MPSTFLFRAGGDQSVRGYGYQELGVQEGDAIVGGRYLLTGSAEYQYWFKPPWGVAVFVDAGNAADKHQGPEAEVGLRHRRALAQPGRTDQRRPRLWPGGQKGAPALLRWDSRSDDDRTTPPPPRPGAAAQAPLAAPRRHRPGRHRRRCWPAPTGTWAAKRRCRCWCSASPTPAAAASSSPASPARCTAPCTSTASCTAAREQLITANNIDIDWSPCQYLSQRHRDQQAARRQPAAWIR